MATRRRTSRETVPKVMTRSMKKLKKKGEKTKGRVTGGSRRGVNVDRGDRYDSEKNSRREESRSAKTREGQY